MQDGPETPENAEPTSDLADDLTAGLVADETGELTADETGELTADDLAQIERDLDGVDAALTRLADGTYWTDDITGEPLADELLTTNPIARSG